MAKNIRTTPRPFLGGFPVVEEYEPTFADIQRDDDRSRWVGYGWTGEFPHNPGSYEEQIDEEEDRRIEKGRRY